MSALDRVAPDLSEQVPLGKYTSLRVGGPARYFLAGGSVGALTRVLDAATEDGCPVLALGGGSNLLISDDGFDGVVIKYTGSGHRLETLDDGSLAVRVAAGTSLSNLARRLAREGVGGLEWAAAVPGNVGGAVVNNAGAFGGCTADYLMDVDVVQAGRGPRTLTPDELGYAYRTSVLKRQELGPLLVTSARLRVERAAAAVSVAKILQFQATRTATQPRQLSAGSIFANPQDDFAGRLVEAAGLKGERIGGAEISGVHANFIVNSGNAVARDVLSLIRLAQATVWDQFNVWLEPEVQLVGSWDPSVREALRHPMQAGPR